MISNSITSVVSVPGERRCRMSVSDGLIAFITILISLLVVVLVVGAAWWLMWKVKNKIITKVPIWYLLPDLIANCLFDMQCQFANV